MKQKTIFGDFIQRVPEQEEYLILDFSVSTLPIKTRWRNNDLSADFIADYFKTFFVYKQEEQGQKVDDIALENIHATVKYITNELLENAMKFQDGESPCQIQCHFSLSNDDVYLYVTNGITSEQCNHLQNFIKQVTEKDPESMYLDAMKTQREGQSGLGLLSMICDYSAKLGWLFESRENDHSLTTVSTMARLKVWPE